MCGGRARAVGVAEAVETGGVAVGPGVLQLGLAVAGLERLGQVQADGAAEHDEVDQAVGAQAVGAVHRHAGRLADGVEAGHHRVRIVARLGDDLAVEVRLDAAHVVVDGRQHRDRRLGDVDAGENLGGLRDAGQALVQDLRVQVVQVQEDMVLVRTDAAAFADLDGHGPADHVARGQVLHRRGVALHEALALGIGQVAAFAAGALGDQAAGAVDAGGVELHELHVLQRQAGAQHHGVAVAGAGVRGGAGEVGAAIAAGGEHYALRHHRQGAAILAGGLQAGHIAGVVQNQFVRGAVAQQRAALLDE